MDISSQNNFYSYFTQKILFLYFYVFQSILKESKNKWLSDPFSFLACSAFPAGKPIKERLWITVPKNFFLFAKSEVLH